MMKTVKKRRGAKKRRYVMLRFCLIGSINRHNDWANQRSTDLPRVTYGFNRRNKSVRRQKGKTKRRKLKMRRQGKRKTRKIVC